MNPQSPVARYLLLVVLWALFGALHSLLLYEPLRQRLEEALGVGRRGYRLIYSLISLAAIAGPVWYSYHLGGLRAWLWPMPWLLAQIAAWLAIAVMLLFTLRSFNAGAYELMGLDAFGGQKDAPEGLVTSGPYAVVRHPMDALSVLLIWLRPLAWADVVMNLVLTAYILLGELHEERRLARAFGRAYLGYKARVPRFIPRLWR